MGEHEQGGMLRVVIVLGLIALIAGASIAGIMTVKGHMQDTTNKVTSTTYPTMSSAKALGFEAYFNQFVNNGYNTDKGSSYNGDVNTVNWVSLHRKASQPGDARIFRNDIWNMAKTVYHSDNSWFRSTDWQANLNGHSYGQGWDLKTGDFKTQIYDESGKPAPSNIYWDDAAQMYKSK